MLKTTSQQLIDSLGYEGGRVGQPLKVGATIDQTNKGVAATAGDLYDVPSGSVFLITHVVMQIDQASDLTTPTTSSSPTSLESFNGISIYDAAGTQQGSFTFRGFARYRGIFNGSGVTPDFRSAQPGEVISWRPKYAIPVPSGWSVKQPQTTIDWGNQSCIYGVLVTESAAQAMGYSTSSSVTDANRRSGVVNTDGSVAEVIAARTGKSIRVLDVHVRSQPEVNGANTMTLAQADGTKVFKFVNDNPAELINESFSPGCYLKAGQALEVSSDNTANCSINISYEYVDEDDVPGDYWFSVVEPDVPTPGSGTIGLLSTFTGVSTEATLYYPRRGETETSPTKGFQHMLNGYAVFAQKTATDEPAVDDTEATRFTISTGATGGNVDFSFGSMNQGNLQLSPVFSASGHDQCTWGVVEGINVPGKKDDGSLWVDTLGFYRTLATPTATDNDVRDWAVNMWGRTAPAQFSPRTNRGT